METSKDEILSPWQLAELLQLQKQTLAVWRTQGKGPDFIKVGRLVRYRKSDVTRWLQNQAVSL